MRGTSIYEQLFLHLVVITTTTLIEAQGSCVPYIKMTPILVGETTVIQEATITCNCCETLQLWRVGRNTTAWIMKTGSISQQMGANSCENNEPALFSNVTCESPSSLNFTSPSTLLLLASVNQQTGPPTLAVSPLFPRLRKLSSTEDLEKKQAYQYIGAIEFGTVPIEVTDVECRANMEEISFQFANMTSRNGSWLAGDLLDQEIMGKTLNEQICGKRADLCSAGTVKPLFEANLLAHIPDDVYDRENGHLRQVSCRIRDNFNSQLDSVPGWTSARKITYYFELPPQRPRPTVQGANPRTPPPLTDIPAIEYIAITLGAFFVIVVVLLVGRARSPAESGGPTEDAVPPKGQISVTSSSGFYSMDNSPGMAKGSGQLNSGELEIEEISPTNNAAILSGTSLVHNTTTSSEQESSLSKHLLRDSAEIDGKRRRAQSSDSMNIAMMRRRMELRREGHSINNLFKVVTRQRQKLAKKEDSEVSRRNGNQTVAEAVRIKTDQLYKLRVTKSTNSLKKSKEIVDITQF